ncbi:RAD55 family ATPase [Methanococcoides burtonii]|uniref:KaiC domain-containing protein n=1 Tax=Methanococcoides burtonii (strain DSM 6242 / NBRC 107633 / OCM 468 / ACE-M) TaxID=259564 RepID=Q12XQ0_METBU|nr:ATPase domain-containing protein [Methanococcoides burtonii]ABE51776.1 KaiC domain-containing protein [Methanococcoides burtonii DSM 6242]
MRFIDTIDGLDDIFSTDIPKGSVILITGVPGSLKSGITFSILSKYLENVGEFGTYITLEQSKDNHLANMKSMGLELSDNLSISDFSDYRLQYDEFSGDLLTLIETNILQYKQKMGDKFTCVALDSLGALYSLLDVEPRDMRKRLYHLFEPLRRENLTTFMILETSESLGLNHANNFENYLADGIIELGLHMKDNTTNRYIQVKKMRASEHSMDPFILTVSDEGLKVYRGNIF